MPGGLSGQDNKLDWAMLAGFASLPGSPFQFKAISAGIQVFSGRYIVSSLSFVNNNAAGVTLSAYDGQDANGEMMGVTYAAAGQTGFIPFGHNGMLTEIGLFIVPSAGPVSGGVSAVPLWTYNVTPPSQ